MKFIKHFYVSKSIENVNKVISRLKRNVGQISVYITSVSQNPMERGDCKLKEYLLSESFKGIMDDR